MAKHLLVNSWSWQNVARQAALHQPQATDRVMLLGSSLKGHGLQALGSHPLFASCRMNLSQPLNPKARKLSVLGAPLALTCRGLALAVHELARADMVSQSKKKRSTFVPAS